MIRGASNQKIGAQLVDAATGLAFTGQVTAYITGDAGIQVLGSVGSGLCVHEGNGYYTYAPSAAETDYTLIAFTFVGTGAVPATVQIYPEFQSGVTTAPAGPGVGVRVLDLVTRSLHLIGVATAGEPLAPEDANAAFAALNDLLETWATESLSVYNISPTDFSLVSGQQKYTLGVGGNFNTVRPVWIDDIKLVQNAGSVNELQFDLYRYTDQTWAEVSLKQITSSLCTGVWLNQNYPLAELWFYPIPNVSTLKARIFLPVAVPAFTSLASTVSLPPGYARALRYNLAIDLAPEFGKPVDAAVARIASTTKAAIQSANITIRELRCDPAISGTGGRFNIFTGNMTRSA